MGQRVGVTIGLGSSHIALEQLGGRPLVQCGDTALLRRTNVAVFGVAYVQNVSCRNAQRGQDVVEQLATALELAYFGGEEEVLVAFVSIAHEQALDEVTRIVRIGYDDDPLPRALRLLEARLAKWMRSQQATVQFHFFGGESLDDFLVEPELGPQGAVALTERDLLATVFVGPVFVGPAFLCPFLGFLARLHEVRDRGAAQGGGLLLQQQEYICGRRKRTNQQGIEEIEGDDAGVGQIHPSSIATSFEKKKAEHRWGLLYDRAAMQPRPEPVPRLDGSGIYFWQRAPRVSSNSAPRRYRMGNMVELLRGSTAVVRSRPETKLFSGARAIICVRPAVDPMSKKTLAQCRRAGTLLVADFDDVMFDGEVEHWPDVMNGKLTVAEAKENQDRYRDSLSLFDAFTASTETLAERLRVATNGARVRVVPNGISEAWLEQGRLLYPHAKKVKHKVIRYLPGSPHDHDFELIAGALSRFLKRHRDVRLDVLGPFERFPGSIPMEQRRHMARVPFAHLPEYLSTSWVTLAPLVDNAFNQAKSAIKFLESAAFGAPCIATPIPDMLKHETGGLQLARTESDWEQALESLLDEKTHRNLRHKGRTWVEQNGMAQTGAEALAKAVAEWTQ